MAQRARQRDHVPHQRVADTVAPPAGEHGNAPDVPVGQQSRASDDATGVILGDRVTAVGVDAVPLERLRDVLLDDEDRPA
jgi:hypothetical protein